MVSPFTIEIPDKRLAAIRAKIKACNGSLLPDAGGWSAGKRLEGAQFFLSGTRIHVPTGVAAFPDPVFLPPRSLVETTYDIVHWTEMRQGGHFAALEEPELMLADLRAFVATASGRRP
jgi:pimeloyl-ACP methyl ester carboxylesterase